MFQKYGAVLGRRGRRGRPAGRPDDRRRRGAHHPGAEAGEDALLLSGAGEGDIQRAAARSLFSARVRWLIANLGTAVIASAHHRRCSAPRSNELVALAVLMPIVASIGGNAGTQTMAVTVRAIATNQLTRANTRRILLRELQGGLR